MTQGTVGIPSDWMGFPQQGRCMEGLVPPCCVPELLCVQWRTLVRPASLRFPCREGKEELMGPPWPASLGLFEAKRTRSRDTAWSIAKSPCTLSVRTVFLSSSRKDRVWSQLCGALSH
jgi:hypothetical protein